MKRYLFSVLAVLFSTLGVNAMSYEEAREQAYYLTDKMAYELNLNDEQYNDAYEINLDYLLNLRTEADIYGPYWEYRNTDLRYILYDWQWSVYAAADYFYRPVWWYNGGWLFPIYNRYVRGYFWYDRPHCFWNYTGAHWHHHHLHASYYANRRHAWNGGMRGRDNTMVGHPYGSRSGRYGATEGGRGNSFQNGRGNGRGNMDNGRGNSRGSYENGRGAGRGTYESGRGTSRGNMESSRDNTSRGTYEQGASRGNTQMGAGRVSNRGSYESTPSRGNYQQSTPSRGMNNQSSTMRGTTSRGNFSGSSSRGTISTPSRSSSSNFGGASRGSSMGGSSRGGSFGGGSMGGGSRGGASMGGGARGGRR